MKKKKIIIIVIILVIGLLFLFKNQIIYKLFDMQYNMETGISSFINVEIDKNQGREKIGSIDNYDIYIEGLKIDGCYFTTIDAKTIYLVDAVNEGKMSIKDMTRKAYRKKKDGNKTIYYYENYKIEIVNNEVLIKNM